MTAPILALLLFSLWTLSLLFATVGWYRWSRILTLRAPIKSFRGDNPAGEMWYLRAIRAHANCVENLPVFTAIVLSVHVLDVQHYSFTFIPFLITLGRVMQSLTHVMFDETNTTVSIRFLFYIVQIIGMAIIIAIILMQIN